MRDLGESLAKAVRAFDLARYCAEHGGDQVGEQEWLLLCPECGKDKLTVSLRKQAWHCWVCEGYSGGRQGRGGLVQLIQLLDRCGPRAAAEKILQGGRFTAVPLDRIDTNLLGVLLDDGAVAPTIPPPEFCRQVADTGNLPYMTRRRIALQDAVAFGLAWCWSGRYQDRLIFPVFEQGRLVYFQARAMWEASEQAPGTRYIKALNPPRDSKHAVSSDVLMNLDIARDYPRVAIVEGPIDCVQTGPSAVCTFGKRIYPRQIGKLVRAGVRAVDLLWDGPTEKEPQGALPEMLAAAPMLAAFFDVRIVLLDRGDPGERTRGELDWYRAHRAQSASQLSGLRLLI